MTVVASAGGVRLISNRDELRTRPAATPPVLTHAGRLQAMWPVDPVSGGTWVGANDAGLVITVLNRGLRTSAPPPGVHSRGTIIPSLLRLSTIDAVLAEALRLKGTFEPFMLVVLHGRQVATVTRITGHTERTAHDLSKPLMFTSSSLGDGLVTGPRQELFDRLVRSSASPLSGQSSFHRHAWKARPEISVRMRRADAQTVSRTAVTISEQSIEMKYTRLHATRRHPTAAVKLSISAS